MIPVRSSVQLFPLPMKNVGHLACMLCKIVFGRGCAMQQELLVVNSVRCHMCVCLWNCHFFPGGIFLQDFGSLGASGSGKRRPQQHYRVFSIFEQKREDTLQTCHKLQNCLLLQNRSFFEGEVKVRFHRQRAFNLNKIYT